MEEERELNIPLFLYIRFSLLLDLLHPSGFDAGSADLYLLDFTVQEDTGLLKVRLPDMLRVPGGMADAISNRRSLTANIAFPRHNQAPIRYFTFSMRTNSITNKEPFGKCPNSTNP